MIRRLRLVLVLAVTAAGCGGTSEPTHAACPLVGSATRLPVFDRAANAEILENAAELQAAAAPAIETAAAELLLVDKKLVELSERAAQSMTLRNEESGDFGELDLTPLEDLQKNPEFIRLSSERGAAVDEIRGWAEAEC